MGTARRACRHSHDSHRDTRGFAVRGRLLVRAAAHQSSGDDRVRGLGRRRNPDRGLLTGPSLRQRRLHHRRIDARDHRLHLARLDRPEPLGKVRIFPAGRRRNAAGRNRNGPGRYRPDPARSLRIRRICDPEPRPDSRRHRLDPMARETLDRSRRIRWTHARAGRLRVRRSTSLGYSRELESARRHRRESGVLPVPHLVHPRRMDAAA